MLLSVKSMCLFLCWYKLNPCVCFYGYFLFLDVSDTNIAILYSSICMPRKLKNVKKCKILGSFFLVFCSWTIENFKLGLSDSRNSKNMKFELIFLVFSSNKF